MTEPEELRCTARVTQAGHRSSTAALTELVYQALLFLDWAVGEGICPTPIEGIPDPADTLMDFTNATGCDAWERLPEIVRDAVRRSGAEITEW